MPPAPLPRFETERLAALRSFSILDTEPESQFDDITQLAALLSGCPIALVSLIDQDRQWFKSRVGMDVTETPREVSFCAYAIHDPFGPLAVQDATLDPRFADNPAVTGEGHIRSYLGLPLVTGEGLALGTLCVADRCVRNFSPELIASLERLARTVVSNIELRRAMHSAQFMALTDPLTGLANRAALLDSLSRTVARQRRTSYGFGLIYLDLDGFKRVNDQLGHSEGDRVLVTIADTLRGAIRQGDEAARIGGDEFALLLVSGDVTEIHRTAERIRAAIEDRMIREGWAVTASVGALLFHEAPGDEISAIALADEQMYIAKAAGKNQLAVSVYGTRQLAQV